MPSESHFIANSFMLVPFPQLLYSPLFAKKSTQLWCPIGEYCKCWVIRTSKTRSPNWRKKGRIWLGACQRSFCLCILLIAFAPSVLAKQITAVSVITVGIPPGVVIIVMAFVPTGVYVHQANTRFDTLNKQIRDSLLWSKLFFPC